MSSKVFALSCLRLGTQLCFYSRKGEQTEARRDQEFTDGLVVRTFDIVMYIHDVVGLSHRVHFKTPKSWLDTEPMSTRPKTNERTQDRPTVDEAGNQTGRLYTSQIDTRGTRRTIIEPAIVHKAHVGNGKKTFYPARRTGPTSGSPDRRGRGERARKKTKKRKKKNGDRRNGDPT